MPLVGELRRRFPAAYIAWATQPVPATLVDGYPGLDELLVVPRDWLKSWREIGRLRRELRARRFDVVIDPQSLTKSALLGWLSGASQRIGFAAPQGRELSLWLNNHRVVPTRDHVVERYLELLHPLVGSSQPSPQFELPVGEHACIAGFLEASQLRGKFAVINPGAGWDSKLWLPDRFGQVAAHLGQHHGLPAVVVWAGDRERAWAEQIVARSAGYAHLAPATDLCQLAELMQRAGLCIAADTGPLHLAAAVGTPCVGLYGSTQPRICGPYGPSHRCVQAFYQDGGSRQRRRAENDAMQAIEVSMVTHACDQLLAAAASDAA